MISDDRRESRKVPRSPERSEGSETREATSRDERFPKEERLVKTKDFRKVYKEGLSIKKEGLALYHLSNGLNISRIGFSIASRNIRLAVRRNKIKRLFREVYRKRKRYLKKGDDIVLVVKKDLSKTGSYKDVEETFMKLAKKAGLLA